MARERFQHRQAQLAVAVFDFSTNSCDSSMFLRTHSPISTSTMLNTNGRRQPTT